MQLLHALRGCAAATFLAAATLASPALHAAEVWTQITTGSGSNSLAGTLGSVGVTMTSSTSGISVAPSINPPYNTYDIWDNDATTVYGGRPVSPNAARIYPTSAKGNMQFVTSAGAPNNIAVVFAEPIVDPMVLVYSLDGVGVGTVDFSASRDTAGQVAQIGAATNNAGTFSPVTLRLFNSAPSSYGFPEGCNQETPTTGRACGVMRFQGSYKELKFFMQNTSGGVGFQVGMDPAVTAAANAAKVPTTSPAGLVAVAAALAALAAAVLRRRSAA